MRHSGPTGGVSYLAFPERHDICPVENLCINDKTQPGKESSFLIVCVMPHKAVATSIVLRWTKKMSEDAGIHATMLG